MAHWSDDDSRLGEILDRTERYTASGPEYWEAYIAGVAVMPAQKRAEELVAWDRKLESETAVTRETAELISKRRELGRLHDMLKSVGR
jgi:hypothetical protein